MTELEQILKNIQNDINTKVKPENIKEGATVFGITGTYTGEEEE